MPQVPRHSKLPVLGPLHLRFLLPGLTYLLLFLVCSPSLSHPPVGLLAGGGSLTHLPAPGLSGTPTLGSPVPSYVLASASPTRTRPWKAGRDLGLCHRGACSTHSSGLLTVTLRNDFERMAPSGFCLLGLLLYPFLLLFPPSVPFPFPPASSVLGVEPSSCKKASKRLFCPGPSRVSFSTRTEAHHRFPGH